MPPRATPADYQAQAKAGAITIAAEFKGHAVPTAQGTLTTEDYVVVETAFFGAGDAKLTLAIGDFTLRINGKKAPLPSLPYGMLMESLKDPEYEPPEAPAPKSKGGMSTGGKGGPGDGPPPAPARIPVPVVRAMVQRVQKAALPEGDRPLPQAGLIFFQHRGKTESIRSLELTYAGPAGKATIALQP